ncbi:integrase core domain-containing protein [Noviherbaspirillum album]|uniref:integrase core domain-containing protein n=1 Tax=Noviherbaspirillum album TaxID=3080276 RepID=UPI00346004DE
MGSRAESFAYTIKREYATPALRAGAKTVMRLLADWVEQCNARHPHSVLWNLPPRTLQREREAVQKGLDRV